ncbi:hypothetical protein [Prevotella rectalis]|uniref:hypothetical protein n=1 Tax=Prevotella rectalis TaxID=2219999 RepID=UPI0013EF2EA6|nr:hypothetical protein [Prevotella brunnea]
MVKITEKNEKQHYVKPEMVALMLENQSLLAGSGPVKPEDKPTEVPGEDGTDAPEGDW